MKRTNKLLALLVCSSLFFTVSKAQLTEAPEGGNKKASTSERIGITDVNIHYDRPGVKGREGQVWGKLVHEGFIDLGFGTSKAAPWRAGANENTTIEFTTPVKVEGQALPAGKYGFHIVYYPTECILIFSKNNSAWGSFFYSDKDDALRVKVKPVALDKSVEWLKYDFINEKENSATVALSWEKLMIPFNVEVDYVSLQIESFRKELEGEKSFRPGWQNWVQAAQFCIQHKTNLDLALQWSDMAVSGVFIGDKNFRTLSTKAQVLTLLNRNAEAETIMKEALPLGKANEVHAYARQLLQQKKAKEALEVFQLNYTKNPNQYTTTLGMARGYSANGDYKKALEFAKKALLLAPDKANKDAVERFIKMLGEGKDIN